MGRKAAKKTSSGKTVRKTKKVQKFMLTKEERLELENLQLKKSALQDRLGMIDSQQQVWVEAVTANHKVNLQEFVINPDTGECNRRELKPVPDAKKEGDE